MAALTALIDSRLAGLPRKLALEWPGGRAGSSQADVRLRLRDIRLLRALARGDIGHVADAYVRGQLDIEGSLHDVMAVAAALVGNPVELGSQRRWQVWLQRWSVQWARRKDADAQQVQFHYDVSDDFFALWLDPLRVYSCAYYAEPSMTLAQAQQAKLDHVCRKLALRPGLRLLDVGAGWGALLLWAAEHYGVEAVGITLSKNQHAHVNRLITERGLSARVQMRLLDYRDLPAAERFDRVASIGMFEHVGRARLTAYFLHLRQRLHPGGLVMNHGITAGGVDNAQLGAGMGDYIEKYIFPGGELEHVSRVVLSLSQAGLELLDAENLRPHYARTLWAWSRGLEQQLDRARELTSEATVRAFRMYLAGCAMGFERGWLSLYQLLAAHPDGQVEGRTLPGAQSAYPFQRAYMYGGSRDEHH
ncbi:MAG: class I SAM-dependent methyltransferase [Rubrivivax sp.]|nr:class I SAM-dependent methyltransferase [Rubrivivax sp.]